jgi:hypothetical protein
MRPREHCLAYFQDGLNRELEHSPRWGMGIFLP